VKVQLKSERMGDLPADWTAAAPIQNDGRDQLRRNGPSLMAMLGRCPARMIPEFLNPPAPGKAGGKGTLVLHLAGQTERFDVEANLGGEAKPIGRGGWKVKVTDYAPDMDRAADGSPTSPIVGFSLLGPGGEVCEYKVMARFTGEVFPANKEARKFDDFQVWY